jgi:hypothetical protein
MSSSDYFKKRAREHRANLGKLAEMLDAGFPEDTLKSFAGAIKEGIRSDMKLADRSELPSDEADAHRAIWSAGCHLGSLLTHSSSHTKWRSDIHTAESDLAAWFHRQTPNQPPEPTSGLTPGRGSS